MGFIDKLKKAKQKYSAWENKRQASELQRLKQARIREEGKAKLRALKAKEMKRIKKARSTGTVKGSGGFFGQVLENAAKADLVGKPKKKDMFGGL